MIDEKRKSHSGSTTTGADQITVAVAMSSEAKKFRKSPTEHYEITGMFEIFYFTSLIKIMYLVIMSIAD